MGATKKEIISAYFLHLEEKLAVAKKIAGQHEEEGLLLCCCYIEALGVRQYQQIDYVEPPRKQIINFSKSRAFTKILIKYSDYSFWDKIHPIGFLNELPESFDNNLQGFAIALTKIGYELRDHNFVIEHIKNEIETQKQMEWLRQNIHRGSLGNIAYSKVRSELVHNITHEPISFQATWEGKNIPDINFSLMSECLAKIIEKLKEKSLSKESFWWEQ